MNRLKIDDNYILIHLGEYLTINEAINLSKINKQCRDSMIINVLNKRILNNTNAILFNNVNNVIYKEYFKFVSIETNNNLHKLKFNGKLDLGFIGIDYYDTFNILAGSKLSIKIITPLRDINCKNLEVRDNDNCENFNISFIDTYHITINLKYTISKDNMVSIDEINYEFQNKKYKIIETIRNFFVLALFFIHTLLKIKYFI
jgi:hypothetical protein